MGTVHWYVLHMCVDMSSYMHVCVCLHVHVSVYIHMCVHLHVHVCVYMCVYLHICVHMLLCVYMGSLSSGVAEYVSASKNCLFDLTTFTLPYCFCFVYSLTPYFRISFLWNFIFNLIALPKYG